MKNAESKLEQIKDLLSKNAGGLSHSQVQDALTLINDDGEASKEANTTNATLEADAAKEEAATLRETNEKLVTQLKENNITPVTEEPAIPEKEVKE